MSSQAHADRLANMLSRTGLVEPVKSGFRPNQVNTILRVTPGLEAKWISLVDKLLISMESSEGKPYVWQGHICKHYFRKPLADGTKKLVFGWNVSIQSDLMSDSLDSMARTIKGEEVKLSSNGVMELDSMPMTGLRGVIDRNSPKNGKGATSVIKQTALTTRRD